MSLLLANARRIASFSESVTTLLLITPNRVRLGKGGNGLGSVVGKLGSTGSCTDGSVVAGVAPSSGVGCVVGCTFVDGGVACVDGSAVLPGGAWGGGGWVLGGLVGSCVLGRVSGGAVVFRSDPRGFVASRCGFGVGLAAGSRAKT